ncbi:hypothetical protein V496_09583 [Pseudogymnoascus sp. VKM F-4515 (FW-2607)]|nr:hypothetical protein V496_09583 [Pseudogymnoascus sp. VKM F-4515 (FW-2607)]KFY90319.1 hypothetical protein V498_06052 [Pseudogymnoascus sp. VKM F-4517 (FW-2822)]
MAAPESYKSWEEMGDDNERIAALKLRYCPPLDETTFLAILSDYDLSSSDDIENACTVLDMVAESVDVEESTGFDPSGSSGAPVADGTDTVAQDNSEGYSTFAWSSTTDDTSLSHGFSALDFEGSDLRDAGRQNSQDRAAGGEANSYDAQFKGMDLAAKEARLVETFPDLKLFDIHWTLTKCKGDTEKAMEELLNLVYLEENVGRQRGIEGFSESDIPSVKKKGRNRKKRQESSAQSAIYAASDAQMEATASKWDSARRDVETISNLTGMPTKQVSSLYHKHGTLVPPVLNAIIDAHLELGIDDSDSSMHLKALELNQDYPAIPITRLLAIVQLCTTAHSSPRDLVRALTSRPSSSAANSHMSPIRLEFRLPPPDLSGPSASKIKPTSHNAVYADGQSSQQSSNYATDGRDYKTLRNEAFNQATAAYRKGKSDRLMGGAAAYYSSVGRDFDAKAKSATSASADATAARQASASQLDLHGIGVADAVRIAREKVTSWWVGMGDRVNGHAGYKIITGKGTHSEGGVARVGPAVSRMLIREGWRVEVGSGSMVVTGVVKVGKGM